MPDFGVVSIPTAMALAGGAAGLGSSIYGMMQGSPSQNLSQNPPPNFATGPQGTALMDWVRQGSANMPGQNLGGTVLPLGQNTMANLYNNPGAQGMVQGANLAGLTGMGVAGNTLGAGGALTGAGMNLFPWANQTLQTAFDPQMDLYNRTLQQTQDQQRVALARRGVNMSPYGAGLENDALRKFNVDWQNAQLGRQLSGLAGAGGAVGQAGQAIQTGQTMQGQVPGQIMAAAGMPYGAQQMVGQGQFDALAKLLGLGTTSQSLAQQPLTNYINLLQAGNQGSQVGNQIYGNQITAANQGFNQNQQLGQNFGRSLAMLGQGFGGVNQPGTGWGNVDMGFGPVPMATRV